MKRRKMSKVLSVIILVLVMMTTMSTIIYASTISNMVSGADDFIESGKDQSHSKINSAFANDKMKSIVDVIYNVFLILGIIIAIIVGLILGIQFITGSVEQKSKIKESIIPYVAGCTVIFGAFGIWRLIIILLR